MIVKKIYFPIFIFLLFYTSTLMSNDIFTIESFLGALPIMRKKNSFFLIIPDSYFKKFSL